MSFSRTRSSPSRPFGWKGSLPTLREFAADGFQRHHGVQVGKIGTDGQSKTKSFPNPAAAQKDADKLIAEKTKKGYEEIEGGSRLPAPCSPGPCAPRRTRRHWGPE